MNNTNIIKLRGHHLLCIQGFQNKGYNKSFIDNMASLISFLNENADVNVKIINWDDDICSFCPNLNSDGFCKDFETNQRIKKRDDLSLDFLDLKYGEIYSYLSILSKMFDVLDFDKVDTICNDCEWQNVCLFYSKF